MRAIRVPYQLLRDVITVEDFRGDGATGPLFDPARTMRASFQPTATLRQLMGGVEVQVDARVTIRPEKGPVPQGSRVTFDGETYRVVRGYAYPTPAKPSHYELLVSSWVGS